MGDGANLSDVWTAFLLDQRRANSERTARWYAKVLRLLEANGISTYDDLQRVPALLAEWRQRLSPATVANYDRAIRGALNWAYRHGYIPKNPLEGVRRPRVAVEVEPFTREEVAAILAQAKASRTRYRDTAIVLVLLDTGIRAGELCNLRLRDIDWTRGTLRVKGKTGERLVPIGPRARRALREYLLRERRAPSPAVEHVFLSGGSPMRETTLNTLLTRLARRAGLTRPKVGPHTYRHTFAVEFLRSGGDVFSLQRILGHASLDMTRVYVRWAVEDISAIHLRHSPVERLL